MCNSANGEIRAEAKRMGVKLWEIAEQLGMNDGNFSRKLRREIPKEEQARIMDIIRKLYNDRQGAI